MSGREVGLLGKLKQNAQMNRLNAVDAAYQGRPTEGSNFKGKWAGYNSDGQALVTYENRTYVAKTLGKHNLVKGSSVALRVGKGIKTTNF